MAALLVGGLAGLALGATPATAAPAQVLRLSYAGDVIHDVETVPCLGATALFTQTLYGRTVITLDPHGGTHVTGTVHGPVTFRLPGSSEEDFVGSTVLHVGNEGQVDLDGAPAGRTVLQLTWSTRGLLQGAPFAFEESAHLRYDAQGVLQQEVDHVTCRT